MRAGENSGAVGRARQMKFRYAGVCRECGAQLPPGSRAVYDGSTKTVHCVGCPDPPSPGLEPSDASATSTSADLHGVAGASARQEYQRRRTAREERIRSKHPKLGGLILALSEDPQSTRAWAVGAVEGEERLSRRVDGLSGPLVRILYDRRIPGTRANIDHLVTCPSGVFVINAKHYFSSVHETVPASSMEPSSQSPLCARPSETTTSASAPHCAS
jgi:hypothetical protein